MDNIFNRPTPSYEEARQEIIADMKNISKVDTSFQITVGTDLYSPDEIRAELENETDFGKEYVRNYINGFEFLKNEK